MIIMTPSVVLNSEEKSATIQTNDECVIVRRNDLMLEHQILLSRIQQLRRILNWAPLPTGKHKDRNHR